MAGKVMQAVSYDSYGGGSAGLKHVEIPVPAPGKGEILVKIEAASINPIDWKVQKGVARPIMPRKFPYTPVSDVAGEVLEIGPGVEKFKVGDKVITYLSKLWIRNLGRSMYNMAGKMMQAVWYTCYGGGSSGLKHVEIPIPVPANDEVLLKIEAASINPIDWKLQKGMVRPILPRKFPYIPVRDVAGEVVEVGAGVKKFKVGDKIVSFLWVAGGGLAEYAVAKESATVPRPPEVSAEDGASLVVAGCTALHALTVTGGLKLNKTEPRTNVLITAGSGGVGHYAVQLAKLGNTHVTATCGARNIKFVKSLGADEVLDYKTQEGAVLKSPSGQKYDIVIHCTTGIPWSTFEPNLSPNGKVIDITPGGSSFWTYAVHKFTFSKKQLQPLFVIPNAREIDCLVKLVKEGKLKTVIDSRYPLSKAEEAWAKSIEGHVTGKVVVEP